jgi:hypothetical protein
VDRANESFPTKFINLRRQDSCPFDDGSRGGNPHQAIDDLRWIPVGSAGCRSWLIPCLIGRQVS